MIFVYSIIGVLILLWLIARLVLEAPDLSALEPHDEVAQNAGNPESDAHKAAVQQFKDDPFDSSDLAAMRERMDAMGSDFDVSGYRITNETAAGVPAEWVLAAGANPNRRVLYIHGGGFTMGSPISHRPLTTRFSQMLDAAVLAIDYRLMPEHKRRDGIDDCKAAYRWILNNGPEGEAAVDSLVVAGDSAGGNLTLMLLAWARDEGLRPADAAVALSPLTDATFGSTTLAQRIDTDHMLGAAIKPLLKMPRAFFLWMVTLQNRVKPADPSISPLFGNLENLPPILVHASTAEVLHDDASRYVARARAAGTNATLEVWDHMLHVWQAFADVPEAHDAYARIELFLKHHVNTAADDMNATRVIAAPVIKQD